MVTDSFTARLGEPLSAASDRILTGPVPEWVRPSAVPVDVKLKEGAPAHWLLVEQQFHAEANLLFHHCARRLETIQAVQDESPWRVDFGPAHQRLILHWIKTRRGGEVIEHTNLSSARVADNAGIGHEPANVLTLSLMLEDVRPGDILEWCYTIEDRPLLLPENRSVLFKFPAETAVAKGLFAVHFAPARPLRWKTSDSGWTLIDSPGSEANRWEWSRENYAGQLAEENTPDWLTSSPWIQVSDVPEWASVSAAFARAWPQAAGDGTVREIAAGLKEKETAGQIEAAIRLVEEEFRLVNRAGPLSAAPPTAPELVARRRYGDARDLAFFLIDLLTEMGAKARPILVSAALRKSLPSFLPMAALFDLVVVEVQSGGVTQWVDVAGRRNRNSRPYGVGLAVANPGADLAAVAEAGAGGSLLDLHETLLLDTTDSWSSLAVVISARGAQAEELRRELETRGPEAWAEKRLKQYARRFKQARRVGEPRHRDNRAANEFFLAEIFEIKDFLGIDEKKKWYKFEVPNDFITGLLFDPGPGVRRSPLALPYPCNIVHTVELHSVALPPVALQQKSVASEFFHFTRQRRAAAGDWTLKLSYTSLQDSVPPEKLREYREKLEQIGENSAWTFLVPPGDARPHQRGDFGALPDKITTVAPAAPVPVKPASTTANPVPAAKAGSVSVPAAKKFSSITLDAEGGGGSSKNGKESRRIKRHKRKDNRVATVWKISILICLLALTLIAIVFLVAKNADRFGVFRHRPDAPAVDLNQIQAP